MGMDVEAYCKVESFEMAQGAIEKISLWSGMGVAKLGARRSWNEELGIEEDALTGEKRWIVWHTLMRYFSPSYAKGYWPTIRLVLVSMMHVTGNAYYQSDSMCGPPGYTEDSWGRLTPNDAITVEEILELDAAWNALNSSGL
jgi:hypothetical protein